jgi:hypothetical protein
MARALSKTKPSYLGKRSVDMQIAKGVKRKLVWLHSRRCGLAQSKGKSPGNPGRQYHWARHLGGTVATLNKSRAGLPADRLGTAYPSLQHPRRWRTHGGGGSSGHAVLRSPEQAAGHVRWFRDRSTFSTCPVCQGAASREPTPLLPCRRADSDSKPSPTARSVRMMTPCA